MMNAAQITVTADQYGRTLVTNHAPGQSRVGIISRDSGAFYFVPTVNHGETVVHGGRSFATLAGAIRAANKFVAA
jgi:hypothetical protein